MSDVARSACSQLRQGLCGGQERQAEGEMAVEVKINIHVHV